jgi:hypothetical protein
VAIYFALGESQVWEGRREGEGVRELDVQGEVYHLRGKMTALCSQLSFARVLIVFKGI